MSSRSASSLPLQWRQASHDVHVASVAGEYAGFIAIAPEGHEAHGRRGEQLGLFGSEAAARTAVAAAVSTGPTPEPAASTEVPGSARSARASRRRRGGTPSATRRR